MDVDKQWFRFNITPSPSPASHVMGEAENIQIRCVTLESQQT